MNCNPTIVVVAFRREYALTRLLSSLAQATYPDVEINLVISIDHSDNQAVLKIAEKFEWKQGPRRIIAHKKNLGLRSHILSCGDLAYEYDCVIVLEDDLVVAPGFYNYSCEVTSHFSEQARIAGFSLYSYSASESSGLPFRILEEGFENYFMKVPSSWGQLWTKSQWADFRKWYSDGQVISESDFIPGNVIAWPESSWKKYFWKYLVDADKYFVYPVVSLTTNAGDSGEHHEEQTNIHQSDLSFKKADFRFTEMEETINVYDQFFELLPEKISALKDFQDDIEVDLNGSKPLGQIAKKYMVSSKKCFKPLKMFPISVFPLPFNLLQPLDIPSLNAHLSLGEKGDFESSIDSSVVEFFSGAISGYVLKNIQEKERKKLAWSDEFVVGVKWLKILSSLPQFLQKPLRKSIFFRNDWNKKI